MAHEFAGALQQAFRIGQLGPAKKSDIHVGFEGVDVSETRVSDARRGMAVMQ